MAAVFLIFALNNASCLLVPSKGTEIIKESKSSYFSIFLNSMYSQRNITNFFLKIYPFYRYLQISQHRKHVPHVTLCLSKGLTLLLVTLCEV